MKPITILALLLPLICPAKTKNKKKGYNILSPSYSVHSFNDAHSTSIRYDGNKPDNYLFPQKAVGHYWGLQYERVTRWGFLYSAGIHYGIRNYEVDIRRDFTGFDPNATKSLDGYVWQHTVAARMQYVGSRYMIGYRQKINKHWAATIKISNGAKRFITGNWGSTLYLANYYDDNGNVIGMQLANIETRFGSPKVNNTQGKFYTPWRNNYPTVISSNELYMGIEHTMSYGILKYISFGVEGGRGWLKKPQNGYGGFQTTAFSSPYGGPPSRDDFYDRNIWMGIRMAAGFWWR